MQAYLDLVRQVLDEGKHKPNVRTGCDTIAYFGAHYRHDLADGFPLLTTKKMHWASVLRELLWYLSGDDHIRNLREMSPCIAVPAVPGYGAAKAGVVQMTKNLAVAWSVDGIRVNAIAPGLIESNMTSIMKGIPALEDPEISRTPMKRWGTPDDIAHVALFLASDASRYLTGQVLHANGGSYMP